MSDLPSSALDFPFPCHRCTSSHRFLPALRRQFSFNTDQKKIKEQREEHQTFAFSP